MGYQPEDMLHINLQLLCEWEMASEKSRHGNKEVIVEGVQPGSEEDIYPNDDQGGDHLLSPTLMFIIIWIHLLYIWSVSMIEVQM